MISALCLGLLFLSGGGMSSGGEELSLSQMHSCLGGNSRADRARAWLALRRMGEKGYPIAFARMANKNDWERASWIFRKAGTRALPYLHAQIDPRYVQKTVRALVILGSSRTLAEASIEKFHALMFHTNEAIRKQSLECLQRVNDARVGTWLMAYLKMPGNFHRLDAQIRDLLIQHGDPDVVAADLVKIAATSAKGLMPLAMTLGRLESHQPLTTFEVLVSALGGMGSKAHEALQGLLEDSREGVRRAAVLCLASAGPEAAVLMEQIDKRALSATQSTWLAHLYAIEKQGRAPALLIPRIQRDLDSGDVNLAAASLRAYRALCQGVHVAIRDARRHPSDNLIDSVAILGRHANLAMIQLSLIPNPSKRIREALRSAAMLPIWHLDPANEKAWHQTFIESQVMR